jgi:hypothetical protein
MTEPMLEHQPARVEHRHVDRHREWILRHEISNVHSFLLSLRTLTSTRDARCDVRHSR